MAKDPYERLGIPSDASPVTARQAYRRQAKRLHPDAGGNDAAMARLAEAYAFVSRTTRHVVRAPRREPRRPRATRAWTDAARDFAQDVIRPQERLLVLALERLELALATTRSVVEVAVQTELAVGMAGSRLARAAWPDELARARGLVGDALRCLADGFTELGEDRAAARKCFGLGRLRLRQAMGALPES
ncbi:MAG: hypothetical protein JWM80_6530 [Cyanobacteria bacterium RYN_339]|nr:hypothetical protein [Cyanobacteria bacterium RYN_339]